MVTIGFSWRAAALIAMQLCVMVVGLTIVVLAPPPRGAILLVPLTSHARSNLAPLAIGRGALLLGRGPIDGSLVVRADRTLMDGMLSEGIVPLAGADTSCVNDGKRRQKS